MSPEITEEQITAKVRASHGALNRRQAEQVLRNQAAHDAFVNGTKPESETKRQTESEDKPQTESEDKPQTEPEVQPEPAPETTKKPKGKAKA
jgi:protein DEK